MKHKKFDDKNGILGVGLIHSYLVLVTLSYHVFMVPRESLDGAIHKLYLSEKAKPMSEIWPNLWNDADFQNAKQYIFDAFMVMDNNSDYFSGITKQQLYPNGGSVYDIIHKYSYQGYYYTGMDDIVYLSANKPIIYYSIHKVSGNLQLCQNKFKRPYIEGGVLPNEIYQSGPWRSLCQAGDMIYSSDTLCTTPYMEPVLKGFQDVSQFYLFSDSHVIIFPVEVYTNPGKQYPLITKNHSSFIYCGKRSINNQSLGEGLNKILI